MVWAGKNTRSEGGLIGPGSEIVRGRMGREDRDEDDGGAIEERNARDSD